jgi:hypothetical protein
MWQLLAAAGMQAGASLLGGMAQDKAIKQAAATDARAAEETRALLGANRDAVTNLYAPTVDMGQDVLGQLGSALPGTPDWNSYVAANPDVAAIHAAMNGQAQADAGQQAFIDGYYADGAPKGESLGQYHARVVGGRAVPTFSDPTAPNGYQVPAYQAPTPYQAPAPYVAPERPTLAPLDVSLDAYEASPDYLYQLTEGSRNLNANFGAKGMLQSGAAMKALQKFGQDSALEDYSQFRNYKTGQYQWDANRSDSNYNWDTSFGRSNYETDRTFGRGVYEDDRDFGRGVYENDRTYVAGRYDANQDKLFDLAGIGERAMDRTAGAADSYTRGVADVTNRSSQTQGQAQIARGANQARTIGQIGGAMSDVLGGMGGASSYGSGSGYSGVRQYGDAQMPVYVTPPRSVYR